MSPMRKRTAREKHVDEEIRDQEVLRANRELASYFKGLRTEREARAALKIVKTFIRRRERMDPAERRPLPGPKTKKASKLRMRKARKVAKKSQSSADPALATSKEGEK